MSQITNIILNKHITPVRVDFILNPTFIRTYLNNLSKIACLLLFFFVQACTIFLTKDGFMSIILEKGGLL